MKQSITMIFADGYAEGFYKQLKDTNNRCIYYFMGIISAADYKPSSNKYDDEINELKKFLNDLGYTSSYLSKLITFSKTKVKEKNIIDDFYVLPDVYLKKAEELAKSEKSVDLKAIHLLKVLINEKFYWLNLDKIENNLVKNEDKIPLNPAKAFILSFYDTKHHLSNRMHIACNGKTIILGRSKDNQIVFDEIHTRISRKHCMITCFNNHYYLEDLKSTQGTYVNDILIGNKTNKSLFIELKNNDVITLADEVKIVVHLLDIKNMKSKVCMSCQQNFYTDKDNDICGICEYEFAKDFNEKLTINEVSFIPRDFSGIVNKIFEKKVESFNGSDCKLVLETKKEVVNPIDKPKKQDMPKKDNEIIPGYEMIKVIGEGGMGKVYLVKEVKTSKLMALKTIKDDQGINEIIKEKFRREASIQEQMNHKYIAKHYSHGEYNGMLYILMEYYAHGTILDYAQTIKNSPKRYEKLKELLIQLLQGLDYLHHASLKVKLATGEVVQVDGVVHRDIKPQNIFVDYDVKSNPIIKIADFGLSKAFEIAGKSGMSKTGYAAGTFTFMPRQQLINTKYAKPEVDIWAAVAIIYYLSSGYFPKTFSQDEDPIITCMEENVIPIKNRVWLFPSKFAKIIDKALNDNCDQLYYQQASDLINDLLKIKV